MLRFGRKGKLSPRVFEPCKAVEHVVPVIYLLSFAARVGKSSWCDSGIGVMGLPVGLVVCYVDGRK